MRLLDRSSFRRWVKTKGMRWRRYPVAPWFGRTQTEAAWPWPKRDGPARPWELADLIIAAVRAGSLGQAGGCYLWPSYGWWVVRDERPFYRVSSALLNGLGIPTGFEGAAYFEEDESDQVAAAVFARCFMIDDYVGDCEDDVYIYPSHGRLYLHFDDEELVWGQAADLEPLRVFAKELERLGWAWLRDPEKNQSQWFDWIGPLP